MADDVAGLVNRHADQCFTAQQEWAMLRSQLVNALSRPVHCSRQGAGFKLLVLLLERWQSGRLRRS
jgi:hypothetical protein